MENTSEACERVYNSAMREASLSFRLLRTEDNNGVRTIYEEDALRIENHVEAAVSAALGSRVTDVRVVLNREVTPSPGPVPGSQRFHLEAKFSWKPAPDQLG